MILKFNEQKKETTATAIIGFVIPSFIHRIDESTNLKERADFFRKILNTDNAIMFSNSASGDEICIVLDIKATSISNKTKIKYTDNGEPDGAYLCTIVKMFDINFESINEIGDLYDV